jgi:predicted O-linked N-acetylglucosamine transferase (SPINDLY family)
VSDFSDKELAYQIRRDEIDILVDLQMHVSRHRLLTFARKPAPIQVTYLAYCGTTGLSAMDYSLTDAYMDPLGRDDSVYSEKSIRLPHSFWCYSPPPEAPIVGSPPFERKGYITFGCLNAFWKVTPEVWMAWAELLNHISDSRLLLNCTQGHLGDRIITHLAKSGVSPERLILVRHVPFDEYLARYGRMDIALDPFPYPGGTTTCDALWMGVPVVSLAGATAISRGGLSILSNLGLSELIAHSVEEYVEIAVQLANDLPRLRELRSTLRQRMQSSPLMNAPAFARDVEAAFREMWRKWYETQ